MNDLKSLADVDSLLVRQPLLRVLCGIPTLLYLAFIFVPAVLGIGRFEKMFKEMEMGPLPFPTECLLYYWNHGGTWITLAASCIVMVLYWNYASKKLVRLIWFNILAFLFFIIYGVGTVYYFLLPLILITDRLNK